MTIFNCILFLVFEGDAKNGQYSSQAQGHGQDLDLRDQCHRLQGHKNVPRGQGHKIDLEAKAIKMFLEAKAIKLTSRRLEALHIAGLKIACSYDKNVQLQFKNMQLIVK